MSEKNEQAAPSAGEQVGNPHEPGDCCAAMRQMIAAIMRARGCCAEPVGSATSESPARPSTCC